MNKATYTCEVCGQSGTKPWRKDRPPPRFCDRRCSGLARVTQKEFPCAHCGRRFMKPLCRQSTERHFCSEACHNDWQATHRKNGRGVLARGRRMDPRTGYVYVGKPPKLEHRVIMERHLGRKLDHSEAVHHRNGVKHDNRIENLEVMPLSDHTRHHATRDTWGKRGEAACLVCGTADQPCKSRGVCARCYEQRRPNRKDTRTNRKPAVWGECGFACCTSCGKTDRPPAARGICRRCYGREYRRGRRRAQTT